MSTAIALSAEQVLARLDEEKLIGVIRTNTSDDALWVCEELIDIGIRVLDVTFSVPEATLVIQQLTQKYPDVIVGAGTLFDAEAAQRAVDAGAKFLVSPSLEEDVVRFGVEKGVLTMPGVFTPTEVRRALSLGALGVKIFPAVHSGPEYLRALLGPMPHLKTVPTGGIDADDFGDFLKAGATAVGIGGHLMRMTAISKRDGEDIRHRAKKFFKQLEEFRREN